jgi:hypothetical protein
MKQSKQKMCVVGWLYVFDIYTIMRVWFYCRSCMRLPRENFDFLEQNLDFHGSYLAFYPHKRSRPCLSHSILNQEGTTGFKRFWFYQQTLPLRHLCMALLDMRKISILHSRVKKLSLSLKICSKSGLCVSEKHFISGWKIWNWGLPKFWKIWNCVYVRYLSPKIC